MRIAELTRYGLSKSIVDVWRREGIEFLLPLQVEAIQCYGILEGRNVLISAPTSSGKTFCGELAALKAVAQNRRGLILVPLKALAFERYAELHRRYASHGLAIIPLSADFPENRYLFQSGRYDIAVVVYEMFNALTAESLGCLDGVGAVVFDEFHLVVSSDRGLAYELAVSKLRRRQNLIQCVGLVAGFDDSHLLADWLGWSHLRFSTRPVELHRGVLCQGKFYYRRYNDSTEGIEYFPADTDVSHDPRLPSELLAAVKHLVNKDGQVLLFAATRAGCYGITAALAEHLELPKAETTLAKLNNLPDTCQKQMLADCLARGVAFHTADLGPSLRRIIEEGFRRKDISVVVATTTLALGVNLPAKNVFVEAIRCKDGGDGTAAMVPLSKHEYNLISGRAGRLGQIRDFGRAIFYASDDTRRQVLWDAYIYGSAKPTLEPLSARRTAELVLRWIACGMARDACDCRELLSQTLRGHQQFFGSSSGCIAAIEKAVDFLCQHGFVEPKGPFLTCTAVGRAVATQNIDLLTAVMIRDGLARLNLQDRRLSWIYYLLDTPDGRACSAWGVGSARLADDLAITLARLFEAYEESPVGPLLELTGAPSSLRVRGKLETFLVLCWAVQPIPTMELEMTFNIGWGRIKNMAEIMANLFRAVTKIGAGGFLSSGQLARLATFSDCLYHCVPEAGLELARLNIPYLERDFVLRLLASSIVTPADIVNAGCDVVAAILPESVARVVFDACQKRVADGCKPVCADPPAAFRGRMLVARKVGQRYEVTIGENRVLLPPRLYVYLHKLYHASHPEGWVEKGCLEPGNNQVKYIYRLRQHLKHVPQATIESDGAGRYRLVLAESVNRPGHVAHDQQIALYGRRGV